MVSASAPIAAEPHLHRSAVRDIEEPRFAWAFWGWVILIAVNVVFFVAELLGHRFGY